MQDITVKLNFARSTKNKHLYTDATGNDVLGSVYIEKSALPEQPPQQITVTIRDWDE